MKEDKLIELRDDVSVIRRVERSSPPGQLEWLLALAGGPPAPSPY